MNRFAVLRLVPPPAVAAAYVLQTFAMTATPLDYLWRPLVVAVISAVVVEVPLVAMLGSTRGALLAAFVVSAALSLWPVAAAIGVAAVWWIGIQGMRSIGGRPPAPPSTLGQIANGAGIFAAILLVLTTATATTAALALPGRAAPPDPAAIDGDAPDIYLLMIDGYPRADTLRTEFGYDGGRFCHPFRRAASPLPQPADRTTATPG